MLRFLRHISSIPGLLQCVVCGELYRLFLIWFILWQHLMSDARGEAASTTRENTFLSTLKLSGFSVRCHPSLTRRWGILQCCQAIITLHHTSWCNQWALILSLSSWKLYSKFTSAVHTESTSLFQGWWQYCIIKRNYQCIMIAWGRKLKYYCRSPLPLVFSSFCPSEWNNKG